jgi:1,4-alpha-glucan branching enzyme
VLVFQRRDRQGRSVVVALNFTPVSRTGYRVGAPASGFWREIFNSDSALYGGSNIGNGAGLMSEDQAWMGYPSSLVLTLPPLGGIILYQD